MLQQDRGAEVVKGEEYRPSERGVPLRSRPKAFGEHRKLPQRGAENGFGLLVHL